MIDFRFGNRFARQRNHWRFCRRSVDRFIECGITPNKITVAIAAGLAKSGKTVFADRSACFHQRPDADEQVKIDIAYNQTNIREVIGVSSTASARPALTASFNPRLCRHACLAQPHCAGPFGLCSRRHRQRWYLVRTNGPAYMRMGRGDVGEFIVTASSLTRCWSGKEVNKGSDITYRSLAAKRSGCFTGRRKIGEKTLFRPVCSTCLQLNPSMRPRFDRPLDKDHHHPRGTQPVRLGEAVAHIVATSATPVPMRIIGFPDEELLVGRSAELAAHYGLSADNVVTAIKTCLRCKYKYEYSGYRSKHGQTSHHFSLPMARWSPARCSTPSNHRSSRPG